VAACLGTAAAAPLATPTLRFEVFSRTGVQLGDVLWTGNRFLYVGENTGAIAQSGPSGQPVQPFAQLPPEQEEMRCLPSPGAHGFRAGDVYCHAPHGTIWRIAPGGTATAFAALPDATQQDGSLAFDRIGRFGFALLAATGGSASNGGAVFAIDPAGTVRRIGAYPGPGGADGIELAPARFGAVSGQLLLAIDKDRAPKRGFVLAMRPDGAVRRIVSLREGLNPIVVVGRGDASVNRARRGLYLTDTFSTNVLFAAAAPLKPWKGSVLVGSESTPHLWLVTPSGSGFQARRVRTNLRNGHRWNLEGAVWVG
jgi:hypothetical protein